MNLIKKIKKFDLSIFFLVISFTIFQFISLLNIQVVYVQSMYWNKLLYLLVAFLILGLAIITIYWLPSLIVFESFTLFIKLEEIRLRYNEKPILEEQEYLPVVNRLHLKLRVIRC